ncbi:uncharacterized protein LOC103860167 [Brassica rapa]|uniref:uncharacterized protein LOC103860167 n=1 Tax=Brassica campestris TaxID=3711 RepID=UPI00142E68CD|nr:uncharacterized protein LOC103860167 [Brassica rapa]
MSKSLFMRIVHRLSTEVEYFAATEDAVGRRSLSPLQKCTAAIRQLAYGGGADTVDEYVRLGKSTARNCLHNFTAAIIDLFGDEYLRRPTPDDLERLLHKGEERGFPGMIGSIDCMHWEWKNCPTSWKVNYNVNGGEYDLAYYLTYGIYPEWATFIKSISLPQGEKDLLFAKRQESARKDVERAFGVLQARFAIIKNPSKLWSKSKIAKIMRACIILHNMIVEDEERADTRDETFHDQDISFCVKMPTELFDALDRRARVRDRPVHRQLKHDLIEHLWDKFGDE